MKKFFVFVAAVVLFSGCNPGAKIPPANKSIFKQLNEYSVKEAFESEYAKKKLAKFKDIKFEFNSNGTGREIAKSNVPAQGYVNAPGTKIAEVCNEAFIDTMFKFARGAKKAQATSVVNIRDNWKGKETKIDGNTYFCMSGGTYVGVMMKADYAK